MSEKKYKWEHTEIPILVQKEKDGLKLGNFALFEDHHKHLGKFWSISVLPYGYRAFMAYRLDSAKLIAEYLFVHYTADFANLTPTIHKGLPNFDTSAIADKFVLDTEFIKILSENAVPFADLLKYEMVSEKSKVRY